VHPLAVDILSGGSVVRAFGLAGIFLILFAETGLLVGFFLPGDTLLFSAGVAASGGLGATVHLPLGWLLVLAPLGAVLGAQVGYLIGRRAGPALFDRPDSRLFRRSHVDRSREYLDSFGEGKAVVIGRFIPVVRTFVNPMVGIVGMPVRDFTVWNLVGGLPWTIGVVLIGYYAGSVHFVRAHIGVLVPVIGVISLIPILFEVVRRRRLAAARGYLASDRPDPIGQTSHQPPG
jgi:membrane-associated protein